MSKQAKKKSFIEITNETRTSRQHIKAEGIIPSIVVALYFAVLVLGAFGEMTKGFFTRILDFIRKLHKHNYLFYGFPKMRPVWFEFSL